MIHASFWAAWTAANRTSDPDEPTLAAYTIDPLLQTIQANLAAARDENRSYQGELLHDVLGMEVDQDSRRVHDCIGLGGWRLYELASGRPVPGQLTTQRSRLTILVFRLQDDQWMVSNMYIGAECS